jgi:hypothetical protein
MPAPLQAIHCLHAPFCDTEHPTAVLFAAAESLALLEHSLESRHHILYPAPIPLTDSLPPTARTGPHYRTVCRVRPAESGVNTRSLVFSYETVVTAVCLVRVHFELALS